MSATNSDRSKHFAAIEKKHGEKATVWLKRLKDLKTDKYQEQIAFLRENHGFSQAHANALVMYHRGSKSSNKFGTPENYFKTIDPQVAKTIKKIFAAVTAKHKNLELVMAWNQPMLRLGTGYIVGVTGAASTALRILPSIAKQLGQVHTVRAVIAEITKK